MKDPTLLVLGGIILVAIGIVVLLFVLVPSKDEECAAGCTARNARMVSRDRFGCICEGSDGQRFDLQAPNDGIQIVYPIGGQH